MGGWWWHCNYSYKLQVQVSYLRFEIDLGPGPELDNTKLSTINRRWLGLHVSGHGH